MRYRPEDRASRKGANSGSSNNADGVSVSPPCAPRQSEETDRKTEHEERQKHQWRAKTPCSRSFELKPEGIDYNIRPDAEDRVCTACPIQSRGRWCYTKRRRQDQFTYATEKDESMGDGPAFAKEACLHSLLIPLDESVSLDEEKFGSDGQTDGFGKRCEEYCGVRKNRRSVGRIVTSRPGWRERQLRRSECPRYQLGPIGRPWLQIKNMMRCSK